MAVGRCSKLQLATLLQLTARLVLIGVCRPFDVHRLASTAFSASTVSSKPHCLLTQRKNVYLSEAVRPECKGTQRGSENNRKAFIGIRTPFMTLYAI